MRSKTGLRPGCQKQLEDLSLFFDKVYIEKDENQNVVLEQNEFFNEPYPIELKKREIDRHL